jgi:hypothetical protein
MIRAAQSALGCASALEHGNRAVALGHLQELRDALTELERLHLTYGEDLKALRRHEQNLTAKVRAVATPHPSSPPAASMWTDRCGRTNHRMTARSGRV